VVVSEWFLPESERPWTSGNLVVPRLHGSDYFARLVEVIEACEAGDRIFFTDWRGDADEKMTDDGPTVAALLREAAARDVEVRALMWRSHPGRRPRGAARRRWVRPPSAARRSRPASR